MSNKYRTWLGCAASWMLAGIAAPAMSQAAGWVVAPATTSSAASLPAPGQVTELQGVSVSGVQPGPGLWKVSRNGHVLWVLGTLEALALQALATACRVPPSSVQLVAVTDALLQQHASTISSLDVGEVQSAFGASPSTRVLQNALTALLAVAQLPLQSLLSSRDGGGNIAANAVPACDVAPGAVDKGVATAK
ncbi:MAG: hypothetical protein WDW36_000583 [Sanguina aurantia]